MAKGKATKSEATTVIASPSSAAKRGIRRFREGRVMSNKMNKTVIVEVVRQVKHAHYGKFIRKSSRFFVHDEKGECGIGDLIRIVETRPISANKRWKVASVVSKAV